MADVDLSVEVNGMHFENPFVLASGPPGTNARVISKSFDLGWGGCVIKTISLDASKVVNTAPRYGKLKSRIKGEVIGFENIELISDRPFDVWIEELIGLKKKYPKKMVIASIMEEYNREAWHEITERVQKTGVDAFELNLSCPHGLPERRMGMAMGENPDMVEEVVGWVKEVSTIPVWAKMTPNIGNPAEPALAAIKAGADGLSTINTILSIIGVDLKTLRPMPTVEGYAVPGGYSGQAVRPIALRHVMEIARAKPGFPISGMGGIETGEDAVQFILLGASTVQVCTGAMLQGYKMVSKLEAGVSAFMQEHGFKNISDFIGKSLDAFTTHADLVARQAAAKAGNSGNSNRDAETWKGDIAKETDALTGG
jgi:dihydroorotate dehydrogenase subfamily 1